MSAAKRARSNRTQFGQRQWGWHCLNRKWANEIVQISHVSSRDLVLDVGAGSGALTVPLAATGARVIAVELHAERAALLRERFGDSPNVKVVRSDAGDLWLPKRPFHVVANPPFGVTAALLKRLLHPSSQLASAHLVLQLQVARKLQTRVIHSDALRRFDVDIALRLPRSAFNPRPKVDTALVRIERKGRGS